MVVSRTSPKPRPSPRGSSANSWLTPRTQSRTMAVTRAASSREVTGTWTDTPFFNTCISQIVSFQNTTLERDYIYCRALAAYIRNSATVERLDLGAEVELT